MTQKNYPVIDISTQSLKNRTIYMYSDVSMYTVERIIGQIEYLNFKSKAPIKLQICSYGGLVDYGLALYDIIKTSKAPIYTYGKGIIASMASILIAAGKKGHRYTSPYTRFMIHQPSGGYQGKVTDMETHVNEAARLKKLLNTLLSADTGQNLAKVAKDLESDCWMTAQAAIKYGLVDKIG